jgi:energy-coupling factor transport system substrate-specific component
MKINTKQLTLMAMLTALSVVGRVFLSAVPNIQPTTVIVIISSFILNPFQAVAVAVSSSFLSNVYLGMGIWTMWQMLAWSVIALISSLIGKHHEKIPLPVLSVYAGFCGLAYGFMVSVPLSKIITDNFWAYYITGLPFDIGHAVGNVIFFTIFYPLFFKIFKDKIGV